ncbi:MAG: hypothetical protein NT166_15680 [Candidatus Aminicenantes bacterium]|nr:hypothetical protein [Candidatus Aminicenantes bacterium]
MLTYYVAGELQHRIDTNALRQLYTIEGGERIGFPLDLACEYLEITLRGNVTLSTDYYIQAGAKAKCSFSGGFNGQLFVWKKDGAIQNPRIETFFEGNDVDRTLGSEGEFYAGGRWKVPAGSANDWTLTIRKYNFDPEEDDVVIGPATPG